MKKDLTLFAFMLLGLASCQKESSTNITKPVTSKVAMKSRSLVSQGPSYTDMTLVAPNTYQAIWNGVGVQVTGVLSYDMVKYPTVVNGIPVLTATTNITTYGPYAWLDSHNDSPDGNVFAVCVPILGGLPSPQFETDYNSYNASWEAFAQAMASYPGYGTPPSVPVLGNYVATTYSGEGHSITYTGKLIKVTTGSGLAIADVNYPLPVSSITESPMTCNLTDPVTHITYAIAGSNSILTSATQYLGTTKYTISGTYQYDNVNDLTIAGTIIRADGSVFNFTHTYYV